MHGTNPVYKPEYNQQLRDVLVVHETFPTVQGEGPFAGHPAFFIRLSHCNLRCYFCDTEFNEQHRMLIDELLLQVSNWRADRGGSNLIVITGGEPLAQNLTWFLRAATTLGFHIQIETAGTLPLLHQGHPVPLISSHGCDPFPGHVSVVCSPKTPKLDKQLIPLVNCYKYIIGQDDELDADDGLPLSSTQRKGDYARLYRPTVQYLMRGSNMIKMFTRPIYIQPRDDGEPTANRVNTLRALGVALDHGYRISLQTHKILGLP